MQISTLKNSIYKQNFTAEYKTEDALILITGCSYKKKDPAEIIKSLTGIDIYSKKYLESLPEDFECLLSEIAIKSLCSDKIIEQNKELEEADLSFNLNYCSLNAKEQRDNWFKAQIKKIGKTVNIEPFTITKDEICKTYKKMQEIFEKFYL